MIGEAAELADALEQDPHDGAHLECWTALGRVTDEDPVYVFNEGDENGANVGVYILTGPFTGCEVRAMLSSPLGGGFESRPIRPGTRVLVHFLEGQVDGLCVVTHTVPGGRENPIPKAIAGVAVDGGGLDQCQLVAPPKGVGVRWYLRGAPAVFRLKGKQTDFSSAFAVECDDGAFLRFVWNGNPNVLAYAFKVKDKKGASITMSDGGIVLESPNGKHKIEVSDEGVFLMGDLIQIAGTLIKLDGNIAENMPPGAPPTPANAVIYGPGGPPAAFVGAPSLRHFVGG